MSYSVSIRADTIALATVLRFYTANGVMPRSISDLINRALRDFARLTVAEGTKMPSLQEAIADLETYAGKELDISSLLSLSTLDEDESAFLESLQKGDNDD